MPQFVMNDAAAPEFNALDSFTQAYIESMFWTEECPGVTIKQFKTKAFQRRLEEGQADGSIPGEAGFSDLAADTLAGIIEDCKAFQESYADDLSAAYEIGSYDESQAGHDFWLTRNGHGAGFWDRGLGAVGDKLTEQCKAYGGVDAYFGDDDKVHLS